MILKTMWSDVQQLVGVSQESRECLSVGTNAIIGKGFKWTLQQYHSDFHRTKCSLDHPKSCISDLMENTGRQDGRLGLICAFRKTL